MLTFFLAQQWKHTPDGKLVNRLRTWAYGKKKSTQIPSHGMKGRINIREKFGREKILAFPFPREGNTMQYKEISEKYKLFQTWEIGLPDQEGWFNISSPKAVNKYLTVTKIGNRNQLTMEEEGEFVVIL